MNQRCGITVAESRPMTEQPSPATDTNSLARPRPIRRWAVAGALGLLIVVSVWRVLFFDLWDSDDFKPPPGWDGKPNLVETAFTKHDAPPNLSFAQRLHHSYDEFRRRHGGKNRSTYTFLARTNALHTVRGLLTQCMEITGTSYLIAPEAYLIEFGHPNPLVGTQWVAAVEGVLQTDQAQCIHPASNHFWREKLLLIRDKPGVVKVLPLSRLAGYQKTGLVSVSYVPAQNSPTPSAK